MGLCSIEEVHLEAINPSFRNDHIEGLVESFAQVAHDIKSPLAVLDTIITTSRDMKQNERDLILSAIKRIKKISSDVLNKRKSIIESNEEICEVNISQLINPLVNETIHLMNSVPGIVINSNDFLSNRFLMVQVRPTEFKRAICNIINNSVESLEGSGFVDVDLHRREDEILISIIDNGKGMPSQIANRLGQEKITYGKKDGNGIGVFTAKNVIEKYGGRLEITTQLGKGTKVDIWMPIFYAGEL
ncbi:MAG: HAMP domain-containing histidine kinase [Deltaproteobacteria bacterium]|nr:MAG: HAMP domain-containing histidine kinase [Deltaproteobacteria bacterium]